MASMLPLIGDASDDTNNGSAFHSDELTEEKLSEDMVQPKVIATAAAAATIIHQLLTTTSTSEDFTKDEQKEKEVRIEIPFIKLQHTQQHDLVLHWQHDDANGRQIQDWRHLPAEMILVIASALDGRSLARLEGTDKFTHSAIAKRSIVLWRTLADRAESQTRWTTRQQGERMTILRHRNPKQYFGERRVLARPFHSQLIQSQLDKLQSLQDQKRSLAFRWYEEIIMPICVFLLLLLFVTFLIYQLQTNDGRVTWMTMSPLLIFCGLVTLSTCLTCTIHYHSRFAPEWAPHLIPNNYSQESKSFINHYIRVLSRRPPSRGFRSSHLLPTRQLLLRFAHASLIMIGVITCIVFISLHVTSTVDWNWAFVFTPFIISMCLIPLIGNVCYPSMPRRTVAFVAKLFFIFSPFLMFIILLTVYLNNGGGSTSSLRLPFVFLPLFLFDIVTFLYTFIPIITNLIVRLWLNDRERSAFLKSCLAFLAWIVFVGPFLYMKIVLSIRVDGGGGDMIVSNVALFLPLFLPLLPIIGGFIYHLLWSEGACHQLILRSSQVATASRQAKKGKVLTLEEMESDSTFVLTIIDHGSLEAIEQMEAELFNRVGTFAIDTYR